MDDPQSPPASSGTKTFGIHKYNPEYCLGARCSGTQREDRRRGYEDKYEDDALYEELSDNARIWRVMLDEGRANDAAMLQRFRDHLDVDLVFSGLFSAVLTTFVVQTSQAPSDTGDTTIALLLEIIAIQRAWANNTRVNDVASFSLPPPSPTPSPWINRCWFLSLIFSLLAAFGAVVVRQWLQEYESDIAGPPKRRALVRHYRRVGLENYKVHLIVPILPMLLHVSLLLFFIGLTLYVRQSDRSMSDGIIALTVIIYLVYLVTNLMPVYRPQCPYRSPLSMEAAWRRHGGRRRAAAEWSSPMLPASVKSASSNIVQQASRLYASANDRLQKLSKVLEETWAGIFRSSTAYELDAVMDDSDTLIPNSLDSMIQASSDLSVTPLVVQAVSGLPIDHGHYSNTIDFDDTRYTELLHHRILPWFVNALSTRRMVFDWLPGRENELQRMACALLLVPVHYGHSINCVVVWDDIDTTKYCTRVFRVLQALTSALLDLPNTPTVTATDVATLSAALLALGNRLHALDLGSALLKDGALLKTIARVYSSLLDSYPPTALRLHPVIWREAVPYLRWRGEPADEKAHFATAIFRSMYAQNSYPNDDIQLKACHTASSHVTLQEWLALHPDGLQTTEIALRGLLCRESCDSLLPYLDEQTRRLHMTCHAIDSYVKGDSANGNAAFDDNLGFLAMRFTDSLLAILKYDSLDSALRITGYVAVSAAFKSTFLTCPALLSTAKSLEADARVPATLTVSLFRLLAKALAALRMSDNSDAQLAIRNIVRVLSRHATEYYDALLCEVSIEHLWPVVEALSWDPALAVLDITDILAAFLTTMLSEATTESNSRIDAKSVPSDHTVDDMVWCLYLDAVCAARANSSQVGKGFADASRKLHSTLLSLKSTYHDTWKRALTRNPNRSIPIAVALALKSTHGCEALVELVDDLPTLMQDPSSDLRVWVPDEEDLNWYRHFTSDPDKHIHAPDRHDIWTLHISELVSFEEAVERMQKSDAERVAKELQQNSRGDGAEPATNDDAEGPGCEHGGLEGGDDHTQRQTVAQLKALGAWVTRPFKSVRPFLGAINRRSPSFALGVRDVDTDLERIAGTSVARDSGRSGGEVLAPMTVSEGGHYDENRRDGEHERDGEYAQDDERGQDDERSQAEDMPHVQRGQTPDEAVGSDAREDVEHGGNTSARGTPDAGRGGEQGHDGEQGHGGEQPARGDQHGEGDAHGRDGEQVGASAQARDGEQDWDGEQARDDAQDPNSAQSQAHEVSHAQTQETEVEIRAHDDATDEGEH
ncbi:hypothetical protein GGF50DRAFT_43424 [Schizophyllum commune]